ncbi:MAG: DUF1824 family protein [Leptolyngbyaceae cyanobacterium CRU_2_3]|nr:DUF1824 family protein [Leptolyngbyaceae cyanobacterium CRU_2_3]
MINPILSAFSLQEAHEILKQFDCTRKGTAIEADRLRQALLLVASQSDYQILGICSETFTQGCQALQEYAQALGHTISLDLKPIDSVTYIKFNPKLGSCYVDTYNGEYRGVLVSCQSTSESGINEMYGHLPLNLFEEAEIIQS